MAALGARLPVRGGPGDAAQSTWWWAAGGVLLGLVMACLVFAPARWLAAGLYAATQGQVLLEDAQGTVWRGSARWQLSGGAGSQGSVALPGRVDWTLRPAWFGVVLVANAPCCMAEPVRLELLARPQGAHLVVQNHRSSWPAGLLAGLGTPWNTMQPEGQLTLVTEGLSVEWSEGRAGMVGRLVLDANDMASRLSTLKPMGSYRLTIHGGSLNSLTLETLQGSLQLSGQGQWVGGRLRFEGVATAAPAQQESLSNLLNIIGRRDGVRSLIKVG